METDIAKYLSEMNRKVRKGYSVHLSSSGRLYYRNHETKTSSWLPPVESWSSGGTSLPYGWEAAIDKDGKAYFINHVNRTTTVEDPRKDTDEEPPKPRGVELFRDSQKGFGFVAGSEKPVIVRFVTEGGPSEGKLLPGDQILKICGEDVYRAPREHVIDLVRSCKHSVTLTVCQPHANNSTRKSALLTAAKKAKLKSNPSRVRFAEGVVINGSPFYCPSPFDSCVPFMPNVLKVFLENGQTKSFKYDSTTIIQDVLNSLQEKLSIKCIEHFSLVVEHIKSQWENKRIILDPKDTLAKIAARPGAHNLRCIFRLSFAPVDVYELLQKDPVAFDYFYVQCCNDIVQEKFAPNLNCDLVLRLAAFHIQQHSLSRGYHGKITLKSIQRECGIEKFVPYSLMSSMKRKELFKLLNQSLKHNQVLIIPGQKHLSSIQAKLLYLSTLSEIPSYGAKCFPINPKNIGAETMAIIIGPKVGVSQISTVRNVAPTSVASFDEISCLEVTREDDYSCRVNIHMKKPEKETVVVFMEDREAEEFMVVLEKYCNLLAENLLTVKWEGREDYQLEAVPPYHTRHTVHECPWSYPPNSDDRNLYSLHTIDLTVPPPPYITCEEQQMSRSTSKEQTHNISSPTSVDHNMNEMQDTPLPASISEDVGKTVISFGDKQLLALNHIQNVDSSANTTHNGLAIPSEQEKCQSSTIDYHSVVSMEILEEGTENDDLGQLQMKSEEAITRVNEMSRMVSDAEEYLSYDRHKYEREDSSAITGDLKSKSCDSLLMLAKRVGATNTNMNELETPTSDVWPSESETESLCTTPASSPSHCPAPEENVLTRKGSSFGLHSPNILPGFDEQTQDIMDLLQKLQAGDELQFAEGSFYLDPDLIDLTIIPPPDDLDEDTADSSFPQPPASFLEQRSIPGKNKEDQKEMSNISNSESLGPHAGVENNLNREMQPDQKPVAAEIGSVHTDLSRINLSAPPVKTPVASQNEQSSQDLDSFLANVSMPPPPPSGGASNNNEDDIFSYIIPPPPSSSQTMEEQNMVIARFFQAADDIRKMMGSNDKGEAILTGINPELIPVPKYVPNVTSEPNAVHNSENTSVISSAGIKKLPPKTLPKTVVPNAVMDNYATGKVLEHSSIHNPVKQPSTTTATAGNTTPVSYTMPKPPDVPLKKKSQPNWRPQPPPRMKRISSLTNDCINGHSLKLPGTSEPSKHFHKTNESQEQLIKLNSELTQVLPTRKLQEGTEYGHYSVPKSHSSFSVSSNANSHSDSIAPPHTYGEESIKHVKQSPFDGTHKEYKVNGNVPKLSNGIGSSMIYNDLNSNIKDQKISNLKSDHLSKYDTIHSRNEKLQNGSVANLGKIFSHHLSLPRKATMSKMKFSIDVEDKRKIFEKASGGFCDATKQKTVHQVQHDISAMVLHLESVSQKYLKTCSSVEINMAKFVTAKEALIAESRQFVTASKLFVKSTTETSEKLDENMKSCLALLERIFTISELVVMHMCSSSQITCLVERLKEVALAYLHTVEAAQSATGDIPNSNMGTLMHQATSLAVSLTTLMRTLRTFNDP